VMLALIKFLTGLKPINSFLSLILFLKTCSVANN
jgi:hypothetical protein